MTLSLRLCLKTICNIDKVYGEEKFLVNARYMVHRQQKYRDLKLTILMLCVKNKETTDKSINPVEV